MVEYGLSDSWEIGAEWDSWVHTNPERGPTTHGVGDLELETKYSFLNLGGSRWSAAVGLGIQLPLGSVDKEISEGFIEYEPTLVVAKDFPEWHGFQLFGQAALGLVQRVKSPEEDDEKEPAAHELLLSGGFLVPFKPCVGTFELTWMNNRWNHGGEENELYATPGFTWKFPDEWEAGIGLPVGLNSTSDHWRIILQITKEF